MWKKAYFPAYLISLGLLQAMNRSMIGSSSIRGLPQTLLIGHSGSGEQGPGLVELFRGDGEHELLLEIRQRVVLKVYAPPHRVCRHLGLP